MKKGVALDAEGSHLAKKVKPFFLCSEKETAAYAVMSGIDYVYDECPYSAGAKTLLYKGLLNRVEEEIACNQARLHERLPQKNEARRRREGEGTEIRVHRVRLSVVRGGVQLLSPGA